MLQGTCNGKQTALEGYSAQRKDTQRIFIPSERAQGLSAQRALRCVRLSAMGRALSTVHERARVLVLESRGARASLVHTYASAAWQQWKRSSLNAWRRARARVGACGCVVACVCARVRARKGVCACAHACASGGASSRARWRVCWHKGTTAHRQHHSTPGRTQRHSFTALRTCDAQPAAVHGTNRYAEHTHTTHSHARARRCRRTHTRSRTRTHTRAPVIAHSGCTFSWAAPFKSGL